MRLLFIRHAIAEDREIHDGNDLQRELSEKGKERADIVSKMLASYYGAPTYIFTSTALRATQTAEITGKHFGVTVLINCSIISPFTACFMLCTRLGFTAILVYA